MTATDSPITGRLTDIHRSIDAQEWNPIHRARLAAGLRELADYLESHPGLRCPYSIDARAITIGEREEDERAEVDYAGHLLNAPVRNNGHYTVERHFGPVSYSVTHIPDQWRHEHDQRASYRDNIVPDVQHTELSVAMRTHRWITDPMPGDAFEAYCLGCGLMILDPQPFDNGLYPILCDSDSTGCTHRIIAAPFGAECHDCGERYENDHTADTL